MRVLLVFPNPEDCLDFRSFKSPILDFLKQVFQGGKTNYTPPLSLLMLAAVTPKDIEVSIVDERIENIDYDDPVDIVGITVVTRAAFRAYEISKEFRNRGVKVVFGGIHPSAMPNEAILHADSVVLGEGENIWLQVLEDYKTGSLKKFYRGIPQLDLSQLPFPRRELIKHPEMYATSKVVYATRGCENTCSFCSAGVGLLKKYRKRSVEHVISELEQVPGKLVIFVDDNIGWDILFIKDLMRAMLPLNLKWTGSVSINALEDDEFIELARKSGCVILSIGFESLNPEVIIRSKKNNTNDPSKYPMLIKKLHKAGIAIQGNFIIGFDEDDISIFDSLVNFINDTHIEIPWISPLIPFPGSQVYKQFEKNGRLLHKDWRHYDNGGGQCVYLPLQMTPQELMIGYINMLKSLFSKRSIMYRLISSGTLSSLAALGLVHINMQYHKSITLREKRVQEYISTHLQD